MLAWQLLRIQRAARTWSPWACRQQLDARAVGCVRVNTEGQAADGISLDAQRAVLRRWEWTVPKCLRDGPRTPGRNRAAGDARPVKEGFEAAMHSKRARILFQARDRKSIKRCLIRGGFCFVAVENTVRALAIMRPSAGQHCDVHYREDPIHDRPNVDDICHHDTIQRRIFGRQEIDAAIDYFLRGLDPSCEVTTEVWAAE
jgi:hypothetical protein